MAKRIIVADICSMVIDGNAVGHYFTVAQNYLDLFKSACNVKIAGGQYIKISLKKRTCYCWIIMQNLAAAR